MPPTTGDLIRLTDHEASVQHNQAVSRDYISQPRLGNQVFVFFQAGNPNGE